MKNRMTSQNKIVVEYDEEWLGAWHWYYATRVRLAPKYEAVTADYTRGDIIYIVINQSENESKHFNSEYDANDCVARWPGSYLLECRVNSVTEPSTYREIDYTDSDSSNRTVEIELSPYNCISSGDTVYVCQIRGGPGVEFAVDVSRETFESNPDKYMLRNLVELVME